MGEGEWEGSDTGDGRGSVEELQVFELGEGKGSVGAGVPDLFCAMDPLQAWNLRPHHISKYLK